MKFNITIYSISLSLILHGLILLRPYSKKMETHKSLFSSKKSSFKVSFNEIKKTTKTKKNKESTKLKSAVPKRNKKAQPAITDNAVTTSKVLQKTIPKYPYKSRKYHEEGIVLLKVFISKDGKALKSDIIQSSGFYRLDQSAVEAAMSSEYVSLVKSGVSRESQLELEFKFELNH